MGMVVIQALGMVAAVFWLIWTYNDIVAGWHDVTLRQPDMEFNCEPIEGRGGEPTRVRDRPTITPSPSPVA